MSDAARLERAAVAVGEAVNELEPLDRDPVLELVYGALSACGEYLTATARQGGE